MLIKYYHIAMLTDVRVSTQNIVFVDYDLPLN